MPAKRARTTNDDPLRLSDVNVDLSGFDNRATTRTADHPESQPVNPSTRQPHKEEQAPSPDLPVNPIAEGAPESASASPTDDPTTLQKENPSTSRQADKTTGRVSPDNESEPPDPSKNLPRKSTRQQVSKSSGKTDSNPTGQPVTLQKATFQIEATVLDRLEKSTLTLQLQLGKKNAPYKEVIVEEAIARLLEQLQKEETETLQALSRRQARRKES